MTKKILISLSVIGIVAAMVVGGTIAYFSDTETSTGNTFSTGVIDIDIDGQNPWTGRWDIEDMKPCETGYINFVIHNLGKNPVNVWKTITVTGTSDNPVNEPECIAQSGNWVDYGNGYYCSGNVPKSNLQNWMYYDLSVKVPIKENSADWYQTIYKDEDKVTVASIKDVFLGMIPAEGEMKVTQSYHLRPDTGNWAQADTMTFDITIYAEQLTGTLVLENKTGDPDWQIVADGIKATLTYNLTSPTFDYSLTGKAPLINTEYCLIYYADPWPGSNGALIGCGKTANGNRTISFSGSAELGDLPRSADQNFPEGAKIWLVKKSDYSPVTAGDQGEMIKWNTDDYLFDTALTTYKDTDN